MNAAQIIQLGALAYAGIGVGFAIAFVCLGITRIDAAARGSSVCFRVMMIPGVAALWPLMLRKWRAAAATMEPNHDPR